MPKGKRPTQSSSSTVRRSVLVIAALAIVAVVVLIVVRPGPRDDATAGSTQGGPGPQPLDVGGGPTVEAAATLDAPPESLASAGPDVPTGIDISNDPRLGSDSARVTIVEFSDFQCPHCANYHLDTFPALRRLYGDEIRFVFVNRFFSRGHPQAERAAMGSECAGQQGRFWEYADLVFANQERLSPGVLDDLAGEAGLDEEAFQACLRSGETASEVAADMAEGDRLEVNATPTFFVNGQRVVGAQPLNVFNQVIAPYFNE
jgi:protein-disulfide isomerase